MGAVAGAAGLAATASAARVVAGATAAIGAARVAPLAWEAARAAEMVVTYRTCTPRGSCSWFLGRGRCPGRDCNKLPYNRHKCPSCSDCELS